MGQERGRPEDLTGRQSGVTIPVRGWGPSTQGSQMPKTAPSQTTKSALVEPAPFRLGTRERRLIHLLVEVASGCRKRLGLREYRDRGERAMTALTLEGVTWALDKLGYPPARYEEVLREYAPVEARERRQAGERKRSQRAPEPEPEPVLEPAPQTEVPSSNVPDVLDVPEKGWIR